MPGLKLSAPGREWGWAHGLRQCSGTVDTAATAMAEATTCSWFSDQFYYCFPCA